MKDNAGRSRRLVRTYCCVLLLLMQQGLVRPQNVSPCPRIFQYVFDGADWIGIVEIPSPMLGETVSINVHLTIRAVLPTSYFGRIELMSPRSEILQDILAHRPVRYRVRFPLPSPIPKLSAIVLNGRPICSAVPDTGGVITTIKLEHTLFTNSAAGAGNSMYNGMQQETFGINFGSTGVGQPIGPEGDNDLWTFGNQQGSHQQRPGQNHNHPTGYPQQYPEQITQPQYPGFQQESNTRPHHHVFQPQEPDSSSVYPGLQPLGPQGQHTPFRPPTSSQSPDWGNLHHQYQTQRPQEALPSRPMVIVPPFRPPTSEPPSRLGEADPNIVLREMDGLCGRAYSSPNNLVVRGEIARKGDWPWLVALYVITDVGLSFNCGASLVSRKLVVTAAHCLFGPDNRQYENERILLILGRYNINDWTDNAVRAPIERAEPHPDYRQNTLGTDADIALLVLRERVQFSDLIRPLCLWRGPDVLDRVVGLNATVVGWGRDETGHKTTPEPRVARIPIVSRETCLLSKEEFRHLITSNRTFCAGAKGSGPCNGDSGGGLMLPQGDRWSLRGIISVSLVEQISKQCDVNEYIVFTDASQFHNWILSYMTE